MAEAKTDEIDEILKEIQVTDHWQMKDLENGSVRVEVQIGDGEAADLSRRIFTAFAERKKVLLELVSKKANLEDVFIELTESNSTEEEPDKTEMETEESEVKDQ